MNAAADENDNMKRAKELIEKYFYQLTEGCSLANCSNRNCASNKDFRRLSKDEAAAKAIKLAKDNTVYLCKNIQKKFTGSAAASSSSTSKQQQASVNSSIKKMKANNANSNNDSDNDEPAKAATTPHVAPSSSTHHKTPPSRSNSISKSLSDQLQDIVKFMSNTKDDDKTNIHPKGTYLTEEKLKILVDKCKCKNNYKALIETIEKGFQDIKLLAISFHSTGHQSTSTPAVDIESIRRSIKLLYSLENDIVDELERALNNAVTALCNTIKMTLCYKKELNDVETNEILHALLIVHELPLLDNPQYMDSCAKFFFTTISELSDIISVRIVHLWSKWSNEELRNILDRTQQYITVCIVTKNFSDSDENQTASSILNSLNDSNSNSIYKSAGIVGAVCLLRILYYASILGGQLDEKAILDKELELEKVENTFFEQQALQQNSDNEDSQQFLNDPQSSVKLDPFEDLLNIRPIDCRKPKLAFNIFINEAANKFILIQNDYIEYKQQQNAASANASSNAAASSGSARTKNFSFLAHPFFLTLSKKNLGLYYDNKIKMIRERRNNIFLSLFEGVVPMPYIKIRINRNNVLAEALNLIELQEEENPSNLRKQFFVEFENEQGIDEGGVSKEFFQLAIDELFNKGFTFFTLDEKTRFYWFNPCTLEPEKEFKLLGTLFGIAIYNNVLLDVQFPPVFFRKLMGKIGTFEDLKESHPHIYTSMVSLLQYNGDDFEDAFMLNFQTTLTDSFGSPVNFNLIEDGDKIPVTRENRKQFVETYTDFILNKSIEDKFNAFRRGFLNVTRSSPLAKWYLPEELEILICGSKALDWESLEGSTNYDGGFTSDHEFIKLFWSLFNSEFTDEQKKLFLKFTTGTDRCPHGGLAELKLIIARNGPDTEKLPTAHTCFNVLLLPEYSSKQRLKEKLLKAIQYAHGFGLS